MLPIWDIPVERVVYLSTGVTTYCIMSRDSNHVPMESDDEHDQLISDDVRTSAKAVAL
jgi:hypothetical protein